MDNRKDSQQEYTQTIDIHLTRGLVIALGCVLFVAAVLGYLVWSERDVAASGAQSISAQSSVPAKYYLTSSTVAANQALTACATGYHLAALWEILDVSNLQYDDTLGAWSSDAGSGPPSDTYGWVRTGYGSSSSTTPGHGNCYVWDTVNGTYSGTRVRLASDWTVAAGVSAPWEAVSATCNNASTRVWCMED